MSRKAKFQQVLNAENAKISFQHSRPVRSAEMSEANFSTDAKISF